MLLVEDDEAVAQVSRRTLEMNGYRMLIATNGEEALRMSREHAGRIDLLLTDVVMPRMSGTELAARLVLERPGIHVLYVSGYPGEATARHGLLDPDIAFMSKPFTPDGLARKVREVLDAPVAH